MSDMMACPHCAEEITNDSDFCPHCGLLLHDDAAVCCDVHTANRAAGVCIICRTLVCAECGQQVSGRMFCTAHRDVEVLQDWALVCESTEIAEAELARSVLEENGHRVIVQNFTSVGYVWDGGGDSPISRSNVNKPAKVFVPIPEYLDAVIVLTEWGSRTIAEDPA